MVRDAGVDTWSVCWYLAEGSKAEKAMQQLATERGPRSMLLPERVADHRVGWFPGPGMLFAEGHPSSDGLCRSDALPEALAGLVEAMRDRGVSPPTRRIAPEQVPVREGGKVEVVTLPYCGWTGFGGIRRLDSTVDLSFDDGHEGIAALAGVAAVPVPRAKTEIVREVGGHRVETVYLLGSSGKRVLGRWYDKGIESGAARRGMLVRPEDQRRFPKRSRLDVEAVASSTYVRDAFVRRFEPLWRASKGVKVAGAIELAQRIRELVEDGSMSASEAKAAAGFLLLECAEANFQSRATRFRDRALCRDHGLVLADGVLDQVEVDLGEIIESALEADCWGQG